MDLFQTTVLLNITCLAIGTAVFLRGSQAARRHGLLVADGRIATARQASPALSLHHGDKLYSVCTNKIRWDQINKLGGS